MDTNDTPTQPEPRDPDDNQDGQAHQPERLPDHPVPPPVPLRGELFADPSARAVWAAILALDPALQHEILRELQGRLAAVASTPGDARIARAVAALREAAEILGRSASVEEYRRAPVIDRLRRCLAAFEREGDQGQLTLQFASTDVAPDAG